MGYFFYEIVYQNGGKANIIKVLGTGCKNCVSLAENTKTAAKEMGIAAEIVKVEDFKEIMAYGVMSLPALVIDEKVVSAGKVLKPKDIEDIIKKVR